MHWRKWFLKKKNEWDEKLLTRQRRVFFRWIESNGVLPYETVKVISLYRTASFCFLNGAWKEIGSSQRKIPDIQYRFILCATDRISEAVILDKMKNWVNIFSADTFEVWESKDFYIQKKCILPLRLGLSDEEKIWMMAEVRRMIGDIFAGKNAKLASDPFGKMHEKQNLDIAVWVKGRIRASVIMIDLSCREALEVGAKRATLDKRFSPLTQEELAEARLEITCMSNLVFPVLESDMSKNRIDPTKGYHVISRKSQKQGWYLPAVHNVVFFPNLKNMLFRLTTEKAKISPEEVNTCSFWEFTVFDWIESDRNIMTLSGQVEKISPRVISEREARFLLDDSVLWLCRMQELDGDISTIFSQKGVVKKTFFPALGFVGYVLASYGSAFQQQYAIETAEKMWILMKKYFDDKKEKTDDKEYYFSIVYFLRFSLTLGKEVNKVLIDDLVEKRTLFRDNPILLLQILSFLVDYEQAGHPEYNSILMKEIKKAHTSFEKNRENFSEQLTSYPELIAIYYGLWKLTQEEKWREKALQMSSWYRTRQRKDGSFPHVPESSYAYTRGTGKIFEVLACFPKENRATLHKAFLWLRSMQYTHQNTFFMNEEEQKQLVGSFRHDAFNREAWVDASAHVILGVIRLLKEEQD